MLSTSIVWAALGYTNSRLAIKQDANFVVVNMDDPNTGHVSMKSE